MPDSPKHETHPDWRNERPYSPPTGEFKPSYKASCHCKKVTYEVSGEPLSAVMCHCTTCQNYHASPSQWAAVFDKDSLRFDPESLEHLSFYNTHDNKPGHNVPCKVRCGTCGSLLADEGRNMWMAFPALFHFGGGHDNIPDKFRPENHIFYSQRVVDLADTHGAKFWSEAKEKSQEVDHLGQPKRDLRSNSEGSEAKKRKVEESTK